MRYSKGDKDSKKCVIPLGIQYVNVNAQKSIEKMFYEIENFKNDFVDYINQVLEKIINEDEELKIIQEKIEHFHKTEGKVAKESEKKQELRDLYKERNWKILHSDKLNFLRISGDFMKKAKIEYKIYLHDDVRTYACQNVIASLEKYLKGEGKIIKKQKHGHSTALASRKYFQDNGTTRCSMIQFEFCDGKMYALIWDLSDEYIKKAKKVLQEKSKILTHNRIKLLLNVNKKDTLQKLVFQSPTYGQSKLVRFWKNGHWKYELQLTVENSSPVVSNFRVKNNVKVAVDYGTETAAIVCSNGYVEIADISPDTPRVTKQIQDIQREITASDIVVNKHLYNDNGTLKSRKEMKEKGLVRTDSVRQIRRRKLVKTLYAKLRRQRRINNETLAKHILSLGSEQITETNSFKAWKTKICRMNDIAKKIYDNGVRNNDYCEQIQDRAVAQIPARIEHVCNEKNLSFKKITGLNLSTYNHFSGKNDLFLQLNDRVVVSNKYFLQHKNKFKVSDFSETFQTIEHNGKKYVLQRDLYAAAKMLFCTSTIKRIKQKNGKYKEVEEWEFDKNGFSKFFNEIFYPAQEKYLKQKFSKLLDGEKMSGTIFGI